MKKLFCFLLVVVLSLALVGCSNNEVDTSKTVYKLGICNYVDDASLNQIIENIEKELVSLETEEIKFDIEIQNCNANAADMNQIISNFINDNVDLMVGVATPVAMAMQSYTMDNNIPVVFAAVSDPVACGVVESLEKPGSNVTGTSDYLDTNAIMNLILALNSDFDKVGLLYDIGQDSSTTSIQAAKKFLDDKGIKYIDYNGTNTIEVQSVIPSIAMDGVKVVFTPSDNTIMTAELSIYEELAKNNIQHFAGADSFALNGAFVGYGVDYANLGKETGDMVYDILVNKKDVSTYSVKTFDNGNATVNTEVCDQLGFNFEEVKEIFTPYCTSVKEIETAESFN